MLRDLPLRRIVGQAHPPRQTALRPGWALRDGLAPALGQEDKDGTMWYHVNFDFEDTKLEGYVVASYVKCEE